MSLIAKLCGVASPTEHTSFGSLESCQLQKVNRTCLISKWNNTHSVTQWAKLGNQMANCHFWLHVCILNWILFGNHTSTKHPSSHCSNALRNFFFWFFFSWKPISLKNFFFVVFANFHRKISKCILGLGFMKCKRCNKSEFHLHHTTRQPNQTEPN